MRFNFPLISSFLLASAALADRGGVSNQSQFAERDFIAASHWTGSVLEGDSHKLNASFNVVGGSFVVPNVQPASDSDDVSGVSIWVGIGGGSFLEFDRNGGSTSSSCESNNIIQAGVSLNVTKEGTVSCTPWFSWYPSSSLGGPEFSISPGQEVRIAVGVTADMSNGTFFAVNAETHNYSYLTTEALYTPCMNYAEWVVEDYKVNNAVIPFAKFTPITFTNAVAYDTKGDMYGPEVGTVANMTSAQPFASVTWGDKNTMTIQSEEL